MQNLARAIEHGDSSMNLTKQEENKEGKQLAVRVPGISVEEEYGAWMKVTRTKRRGQKNDSFHQQINKQNGNGRVNAKQGEKQAGTRFDILRETDAEDTYSGGIKNNTKRGHATQWKRKEIGETSNTKKDLQSTSLPGTEIMVIEKGNTVLHEKEIKQMETETNSGMKIEQRNSKQSEPTKESNRGLESRARVSKKKENITATKVIPNTLKKKKVGRTHKIVFGSLLKGGTSVINQALEQLSQSEDLRCKEMREVDQVCDEICNPPVQNQEIASQVPEHAQSLDSILESHVSASYNERYIQNDT